MSERSRLPVGRLFAEFAVIVVGVLVALFTESAWQERGDRVEEAEVLRRITGEIRADSSSLATAGLWLEFVVPSAERVPDILAGRDTLPAHNQLALLYAAATVNRPGSTFWTWDELRETGRTSLIQDRELRSRLTRYFGLSAEFARGRAELPDTYRAVATGMIPAEFTLRVLNRCLRAEAGSESGPRTNALAALEACDEVPRADARSLLDELQEYDGLAVEAGRLAYELGQIAEEFETLVEERRATLAALEGRGAGGAD